MEKHTRGPWIISKLNGDLPLCVAQVFLPVDGTGTKPETRAANAHLIAAAPELLSLAKMFEAHTMGYGIGKGGKPFTPDELLSFIKDHINKAEGR